MTDNAPMDKNADAELRQRAEDLAAQAPEDASLSLEETRRTLHELRVHQIELDLQNEELRRAQVELEGVRARFFDLYDLAPVGYVTLSEPGLIVEANLTAARMLGMARGALSGQPISRFILKEDADNYYLFRNRLFETREPQECEVRMVKRDGSPFWAHVAATAAHDPAGAPVSLVTLSDITKRKRTEAELQKMQKLQSIGTLAGGIAHAFNNILLGVFGNISLAKNDLGKEHPSFSFLEEAEKSMTRAVRLTKQLLTFAKGGDPVKEDVSLGALVNDVAQFELSGSPVKLVYQQAADLWLAKADKGQIQQVISNLVINARQAMPAGGHLHIGLGNAVLQEAALPSLRKGNYIKVTVRDEGIGIDPKIINQIFDPYFTTKPSGSSLGLATVYSIIHKHGGQISVVSELGHGTTFTFYLPASASPHRIPTEPPAAACQPPARPARILVMDDDEAVSKLALRMLTRSGYAVVTVPDGQEAIARYKQALAAGEPFDAVIMDLTIPGGIGGKDAIIDLLALDPHVRAIVSSGYADDPVMANYADYGFKGVAAKPYTQSELRGVVGRVLK